MTKNAVYFFAQYPKNFALCAGLAEIIREEKPNLPLHLICANEPNSTGYRWDMFLEPFDTVQWIHKTAHGSMRGGLSLRGFGSAMTRTFPALLKARAEMRRLRFEPNSVAFVFDGFTLDQSLFLRRVREEPGVSSVLITEHFDEGLLGEFVLNYKESLHHNVFQRFFGTAYFDILYLRTPGGTGTRQRYNLFRNKPADYTFFGQHAFRVSTLGPGQVYWPFYRRDQSHSATDHSVIVFGGIYYVEPLISHDPFYRRYNEMLDLIRAKHQGQRLIYLPHPALPGQHEREIDRLDLHGFEIPRDISSEAIVAEDRSITTAYAVFSTSLFSVSCFGVRTYWLYRLFEDESMPELLKEYQDRRWLPRLQPKMRLTSVEEWMSGKADYTLVPSTDRVRATTLEMLETVGVLDAGQSGAAYNGSSVKPEERWLTPPAPWTPVGVLRSVIGIPPNYSLRRRLLRALGTPVRLAIKLLPRAWHAGSRLRQ